MPDETGQSPDLNADFGRRVVVDTESLAWRPGPTPKSRWKLLHADRATGVERMTAIVRYDAGSRIPAHAPRGGEELFVLDGDIADAAGVHRAGCYLLTPENAVGDRETRAGCTLLVKTGHCGGGDRPLLRCDTRALDWQARRRGGTAEMPLYQQDGYSGRTSLIRFDPGAQGPKHGHPFGEEVLILEGSLADESGAYPTGSWIRNPAGSTHTPYSTDGCVFFLRTGSVL